MNHAPIHLSASMLTDLGNSGSLSTPLQILLAMTALTVLPSVLLMMTGFTRILIVLSILRQALGMQQTPPNQVLAGMALFLTLFVMRPVIAEIDAQAWQPYQSGKLRPELAIARGGAVMHRFMVAQTRERDLAAFIKMGDAPTPASAADVPFTILLPAFVTSEVKTAFQIGFLIFLPFLVIDLLVASTLMSLGMMMLSPSVVSLPFKLLLFVLVDGWTLTMGSLAGSFVT